jgi:hypothetical protein
MSEIKDLKSSHEARVDSSIESILRDEPPKVPVVREPRSVLAFKYEVRQPAEELLIKSDDLLKKEYLVHLQR